MFDLLLDLKNISDKTQDVLTKFNKPFLKDKSIYFNGVEDGIFNNYLSLIDDKRSDSILLYYRACNPNKKIIEELKKPKRFKHVKNTWSGSSRLDLVDQATKNIEIACVAKSIDGITFEKVKPLFKNGHFLEKTFYGIAHNFVPFLDKNNLYKAIGGTSTLYLIESDDGINWINARTILSEEHIVSGWFHPNHFDSQNVVVYDDENDIYKIYLRNNQFNQRHIQFSETKDFTSFNKCKEISLDYEYNLYNPNIFKLPNTNLYLGYISTSMSNDDPKRCIMIFSSDGINFSIGDEQISSVIDSNKDIYVAHNCIIRNNDIYIYVYIPQDQTAWCYYYPKYRIHEYYTETYGSIIFNIKNPNIALNYKCLDSGYIDAHLLLDDQVVASFHNIRGDEYNKIVDWNLQTDIETDNKQISIKLDLHKASVFGIEYLKNNKLGTQQK